MPWLYRLQQRVAVTGTECTALLAVVLTLVAGLAVRQVQGAQAPPAADFYTAPDARFAVPSAPGAQGTPSTRALVALADTTAAGAPAGMPADSATVDAGALAAADSAALAHLGDVSDAPPRARSSRQPGPVRMNINTADAALLERLPRVGPKLAERILAYRAAHGRFGSAAELIEVKGIGPKTFAQMEPFVYVE